MNLRKLLVGVVVLSVLVGGGYYYWLENIANQLPDGIYSSNGRIEAGQVNVSVKRAARVQEILVREGDMIEKGAVVARMDTAELEAEIKVAEANIQLSEKSLEEALASVESRKSTLVYASNELQRTQKLHERGYASTEKLDQRRNEFTAADAAMRAANASVAQAEAALEAARQNRLRLLAVLADYELTAPIRGRVQYRLAEPGEVLAAGGNVVTLVNLSDVYMTVFLAAETVGRLAVGGDARLILDPAPDLVIPAKVSFISSDAQFTPKAVETVDERSKLVFRVKLRIAPTLLRKYEGRVKAGVRGVGYVKPDPNIEWPKNLEVSLPK
ncbi:HlyD family secretion protein [Sneathiella limimaris]|uniref:HlyD family secretion protein n=1 Tax=Sneathiella limimaris TaxID=1964213 RepID=UPI00146E607C|nr:HlyD family efflux transporter periplasmic adaptor subunit [Sneathiella limimaris]